MARVLASVQTLEKVTCLKAYKTFVGLFVRCYRNKYAVVVVAVIVVVVITVVVGITLFC